MRVNRRKFLRTAGATATIGTGGRGVAKSLETPTTQLVARQPANLCFASARELVRLIRERKLSAREVMSAHLEQIRRINPKINAIVAKQNDERCLALADEADRRLARKERLGPLHGLPIAFKDYEAAVGFPWTRGSPIYKDFMPQEDSLLVERLRTAGAVPIAKTNVPEFAMGSHTYNKVYGTTFNPYDLSKSAGGSSGGACWWPCADCRWQRLGRLSPESGQLQQHRCIAPDSRTGADGAESDAVHRIRRQRPDGPLRSGCRIPAQCDCGPRFA